MKNLRSKNQPMLFAAFTLAEILIVLGIIGIIAEMTIPTLIHDTQERELKGALRKNYSIINEATQMIKLNNGGTVKGAFTGATDLAYSLSIRDTYATYLRVSKSCDAFGSGGCFSTVVRSLDNSANSVPTGIGGTWLPGAILQDGTNYIFNYSTATPASCASTGFCGQLWVDVNGFKKPNVMGRDVFVFNIRDDRVDPVGKGSNYDNCENDTGTYSGSNCTAKYILQQ